MGAADDLRAAKARIGKKSDWCRDSMARNVTGYSCEANDEHAVQFCALGALDVVRGSGDAEDYLNQAAHELYPSRITEVDPDDDPSPPAAQVNDHNLTKHSHVMRLYDRAIEMAEEAERSTKT